MLRCRTVAAPRASLSWTNTRPILCHSSFHTGPARQHATPVDGPLDLDSTSQQHESTSPPIRKHKAFPGIKKHGVMNGYDKLLAAAEQGAHKSQGQSQPPQEEGHQPRKRTITDGRACSVLTSTPQSTSLADLLARLPSLKKENIGKAFGMLVLLVTPAYASAARHEKDLIDQAIKRIYPETTHVRYGLHALVGVVDRLPRPAAPGRDSASNRGGAEGLAFMFTDDVADVPHLFLERTQDPAESIRDVASSFQIRRSLTFDIITEQAYERSDAGTRHHLTDSIGRSYSVQVPLSNTIFQNGLPSTLIHTRYDKSNGDDWVRTHSQHLNNQTLRLPFFAADEKGSNLALTAPLVALTPARSVVASMGNIIRRLSADPYTSSKPPVDNTILASQELEDSVQAYFKARDIPPQQVSVWALVVPRKAFAAHSTSMIDVLQPQNLVQRWKDNTLTWIDSAAHTPLSLLQHHARLHKVLSGGGGWGKKAGLLSLDPDSSYSAEESSNQETPFFAGLQLEMEERESALRDIVSPGDYIQYYISPTASSAPAQENEAYKHDSESRSAEFGAIPSTIDTMPEVTSKAESNQSSIQVYMNHFGALSEVGIALTVNEQNLRDPEHVETLNQTKVDVPFARFNLLSTADGKDVASSEAGDPNKRMNRPWGMLHDSERPSRDIEKRTSDTKNLGFRPTKPMHSKATNHSSKAQSRPSDAEDGSHIIAREESSDWLAFAMNGRKRNREQQRKAKHMRKSEVKSQPPSHLHAPAPTSSKTNTDKQKRRHNIHTPLAVSHNPSIERQCNGRSSSMLISEVSTSSARKQHEAGDDCFSWLELMKGRKKRSVKRTRSPLVRKAAEDHVSSCEDLLFTPQRDERQKAVRQKHQEKQALMPVRKIRVAEQVQFLAQTKQRSRANLLHRRTLESQRRSLIRKVALDHNSNWEDMLFAPQRDDKREEAKQKHQENKLHMLVRKMRVTEQVQSRTRTKQRSRAKFLYRRRLESQERTEVAKHAIWADVMSTISRRSLAQPEEPARTMTDMKGQRRSIKPSSHARRVEESVRQLFSSNK